MVIHVIECNTGCLLWNPKLGFWCRFLKKAGWTMAASVMRHCDGMARSGRKLRIAENKSFAALIAKPFTVHVVQQEDDPSMFRGPR